jgi:hypothetical protein
LNQNSEDRDKDKRREEGNYVAGKHGVTKDISNCFA